MQISKAIIEAAIDGFERQKQRIDETIAELRAQLDGGKTGRTAKVASAPTKGKRNMSAAARKRIGDTQKERWKRFHANQKAAATPAKKAAPKKAAKKRTMSPERKAALVANLAKARAAKAKKAATA